MDLILNHRDINTMFLRGLSIFLALESILHAALPINGLYSTGFGGLAILPANFSDNNAGYQIDNSDYNSGFNAGGAIGYKNALWRYEAEVSYVKAPLTSLMVNGLKTGDLEGYSQGLFGLANLYFDFPTRMNSVLQPFIGAGIGGGWIQNSYAINNLIQNQLNGSAFAYEGTAGISYNFSEAYSLAFYYRYLGTSQVSALNNTFQAHLFNGSLSYRFDID
jgi:opacity protein-like surface antigen